MHRKRQYYDYRVLETLCITPRRHNCLTQAAVILPYKGYQRLRYHCCALQQYVTSSQKIYTNVYIFRLCHGPLGKQGLSSAASKGHVRGL